MDTRQILLQLLQSSLASIGRKRVLTQDALTISIHFLRNWISMKIVVGRRIKVCLRQRVNVQTEATLKALKWILPSSASMHLLLWSVCDTEGIGCWWRSIDSVRSAAIFHRSQMGSTIRLRVLLKTVNVRRVNFIPFFIGWILVYLRRTRRRCQPRLSMPVNSVSY